MARKKAKKRSEDADAKAEQASEPARVFRTPPMLPLPRVLDPSIEHSTSRAAGDQPEQGSLIYSLKFSHGQTLTVTGDGVVGRRPSTDGGYTHAIEIQDPHKMLSRNHFEFGLTATNQLWAADLDSTNGTFIYEKQRQRTLTPHEREAINPGAMILFGDNSATVQTRQGQPAG
jgi:FHA domain